MSSPVNVFGASPYEIPPILRLPPETLSSIFAYASSSDLVNISLVSKSFRDIAAAQLYRSLSHIFDERDTRTGQLAVDRLTGVLDTLITSDYNYAAYIKEISLDTVQGSHIGMNVALEFKYGSSCGKFLNTLLLATIKKIPALESFRWNVRVEISPAIFETLGKHGSLQNVHVRLQDGQSTHPSPPMAPSSGTFSFNVPASSIPPTTRLFSNNNVKPAKRLNIQKFPHSARTFSKFSSLKSLAVLDMDTLEYVQEIAECISSSSTTLKTLKLSFSESLALKARKKTVVNVSDTDTAQDDDDGGAFLNDPLMQSPAPPPPVTSQLFGNISTPSDVDMRHERAAQEKALARIFGLEKETVAQQKLEKIADRAIYDADKEIRLALKPSKYDEDRMFVEKLSTIVRGLAQSKGAHAASSKSLKALQKVEKVVAAYLEKKEIADGYRKMKKKALANQQPSHKVPPVPKSISPFTTNIPQSKNIFGLDEGSPPVQHPGMIYPPPPPPPPPSQLPPSSKSIFSQSSKGTYPLGSSYVTQGPIHKNNTLHSGKPVPGWKPAAKAFIDYSSSTSDAGESVFNKFLEVQNQSHQPSFILKPEEKKFEDELQDIVDLEHPDEVNCEGGEDQEFLDLTDSSMEDESPLPCSGGILNEPQASLFPSGADGHASSSSSKGKQPVKVSDDSWMTGVPTSVAHPDTGAMEDTEDAIQAYIRLHHGIPVESLSIYLIPVKPSVLCRAVNLSSLRHLSLLNVGPQRPFWSMLSKLQRSTPLQLVSIHTDNVTPSFLAFLNGLSYLEELFMVERIARSKVESLAPRTQVVIEDIQKQVLAKHAKHLKRLMIRNDEDSTWALNRESVALICKRGFALKELVVAMASPNFV
ncbi:F-box domain-containing protein, partial [Histoplasma capsulatum]